MLKKYYQNNCSIYEAVRILISTVHLLLSDTVIYICYLRFFPPYL